MNKNCAFTICTRSYIGLAETLKDSFLKYNEEFDFYIIFCDGDSKPEELIISGNEIIGLGEEKYEELAFKYNVTEFCTCLKPFGFTYFFNKDYETVAYFDPDILFFSRFKELYEDYSVFLTPHILDVESENNNDWGQEQFLKFGIYNCGFVGLKNDNNGKLVANWWGKQLLDKAFADPFGGMYTDQKWIDMVPSFIELSRIKIIKNYGCDFAPWNYAERTINNCNDILFAVSRINPNKKDNLVFVHYSAYNYKKLLQNNIIESKYSFSNYPEMDILLEKYRDKLAEHNTLEYFSIKYKYSEFENGIPILELHRRLYRALIENGYIIKKPFSCGKKTFFFMLKKTKLISKTLVSTYNKENIKHYRTKNSIFEKIYLFILKFIGIDNYILLLRKIERSSKFENQLFLLNKELSKHNK